MVIVCINGVSEYRQGLTMVHRPGLPTQPAAGPAEDPLPSLPPAADDVRHTTPAAHAPGPGRARKVSTGTGSENMLSKSDSVSPGLCTQV